MAEDKILTPEQVEEIRKRARGVGESYKDIAKDYGIDAGHVRYIANREEKTK